HSLISDRHEVVHRVRREREFTELFSAQVCLKRQLAAGYIPEAERITARGDGLAVRREGDPHGRVLLSPLARPDLSAGGESGEDQAMDNQPFLAIEPEACHREGFPVGREGEVMDVIPADIEPAN